MAELQDVPQASRDRGHPPTRQLFPPPSALRARIIWVLDDSPTEAELVRRALRESFQVEVFLDGAAMLERLSKGNPPDVLVVDWVMPGISGVEICQYLRTQSATRTLPVLLLTAQGSKDDVVAGLNAGADDYVAKPFHPEEVRARVKALLRTKSALEQSAQAEEFTREILLHVPEALFTLDPDRKITFANQAAERLLQRGWEDLTGQPIEQLLPGLQLAPFEEIPENDLVTLPDVRREDEYYAPVVSRQRHQGPSILTLSLRNVSAQRQRETRRLDFYSIIAHDLRTPLSAAMMRNARLLSGKVAPLTDEVRRMLELIQARLKDLSVMIDDFLDFARMDAGVLHLSAEPLDLAALSLELIDEFRQLAEAKSVTLHCAASGLPAVVRADRRRIGQVMTNLLSNAIKFTPSGGRVEVRIEQRGEWIELAVQDTGTGIPAESLAQLFRRYARSPDAERSVAGTGLGLLIVRDLVEAHGGSVGATSEPGKGSVFWFRLPHAAEPGAAEPG